MEEKDILEQIRSFPQKLDLKENATADAKALAKKLYVDKKSAKHKIQLRAVIGAALAFIMILAIALPIGLHFLSNPTIDGGIIFYDNGELRQEEMDDIQNVISENQLNFHYFQKGYLSSTYIVHYVREDDSFAYLKQNVMFIGEQGFETIELNVSPSKNRFNDFNTYFDIVESYNIGERTCWYEEVDASETYKVYQVRIEEEDYFYYLSLRVADFERVTYFVNFLFEG